MHSYESEILDCHPQGCFASMVCWGLLLLSMPLSLAHVGWDELCIFFFIFGHARDMYIHVKNLIVFEAALRVPGCLGCEVTENLVRTLWRRHLMVARLT